MDNYVQLHLKASKTEPSRYGIQNIVVQIKRQFEIMSFHKCHQPAHMGRLV